MMRLRKIWAEGSFSVLKREHCISKIRKRGISAAAEECLLAVMALNLKRMVIVCFKTIKVTKQGYRQDRQQRENRVLSSHIWWQNGGCFSA